MPLWVTVLDAAAAWGRVPWDLAGDDDELVWLWRFELLENQRRHEENLRATHG